jgi:hypothetical protein
LVEHFFSIPVRIEILTALIRREIACKQKIVVDGEYIRKSLNSISSADEEK